MNLEDIIYELSYNDIMELPQELQVPLILKFKEISTSIPEEIYSNRKSLLTMLYETERQEYLMTSDYTFSGEKVKYYPNITFRKTLVQYTCPVSGSIYSKGSECLIFKPFFYLPNKRECYVLDRPIKANYYYEDFFPKTIKEYDDFSYRVEKSYELGDEEYYEFYSNIGRSLTLRHLKSKK